MKRGSLDKWKDISFIIMIVLLISLIFVGCGEEKKQGTAKQNVVVLDRSKTSVERQMVEQSFCLTVHQYIYARLLTEKVARLDSKTPKKEGLALIYKAANAWKCAAAMTNRTERMANRMMGLVLMDEQVSNAQNNKARKNKDKAQPKQNPKKKNVQKQKLKQKQKPKKKTVAVMLHEMETEELTLQGTMTSLLPASSYSAGKYFTFPEYSFCSRAFAAESGVITAKEGTKEWANQIQAVYDAFPSGKKIAGLAYNLGTSNMKEAHEKLVMAGKIVEKEGKWDVAKATAKSIGKNAAVAGAVVAVVAVPVGCIAAATALETGVVAGSAVAIGKGAVIFGVGMAATVSGVVSATAHGTEEATGKKLVTDPDSVKMLNTIDTVSLITNSTSLVMNGGKAVGTALSKVSETGANASKLTKASTFAKEFAKEYFTKGAAQEHFNSPLAQTIMTANDTYSVADGWIQKGVDIVPGKDEKGNAGVVPIDINKEKVPAGAVKTIEIASDKELSTATNSIEQSGTSAERVSRSTHLEKMQKQNKSEDDWIYWNSNGIKKAEYNHIMNSYPTDFREHVQKRLDDYKESDAYKEELEKRKQEKEDKEKEESKESGTESGNESGVESDDAPFAMHKVIGAKGNVKEDESAKGAIDGIVHWTHHLEIVRDGKGLAVSDNWVATSGPVAKSTGKKVFKIVGYDTETGEGTVKVYERSYPLKIKESKGSMGIHIEGFSGLKDVSKKL